MTAYLIEEVDGVAKREILHYLNAQEPDRFPPLQDYHLRNGYWWLARAAHNHIVGMTGMVSMTPFDGVGFLKRAYVSPHYRGKGLQREFIRLREIRAYQLGWHMLVADIGGDNAPSIRNLELAGFARCNPEQPWGKPGDVYFEKRLA